MEDGTHDFVRGCAEPTLGAGSAVGGWRGRVSAAPRISLARRASLRVVTEGCMSRPGDGDGG